MSATVFCGECGSPIAATAKFCITCGAAQEPVIAPPTLENSRPPEVAAAAEMPFGSDIAPPEPATGPELWGGSQNDPTEHSATGPGRAEPMAAPEEPIKATASAEGPVQPPPLSLPTAAQAAQKVEQVAPGASELAEALAARLSTPGAFAAGSIAGLALMACLVVAAVLALATPDNSLLGVVPGLGVGFVGEWLRDTVSFTMAHVKSVGESRGDNTLTPGVFLFVPVLGAFIGARRVAPSLASMTPVTRLAWCAVGAALFAAVMLVIGVVANGQGPGSDGSAPDFKLGSVLLASFVSAALGAVLGVLTAPDLRATANPVGSAAASWIRALVTPLRALAVLFVVATVVAAVHIEVQTLRDQSSTDPFGRSVGGAAVENLFIVPDSGRDAAALGLLAEVNSTPLPPSDDKVAAFYESAKDGDGRIFDLSSALPAWVFILELLLLVGTAVLAALYAGFSTARVAGASTTAVAAGFGALTGIVWAVALILLRELTGGVTISGGSLFASALLVGTVGGAVGGALAVRPAGALPSSAPVGRP